LRVLKNRQVHLNDLGLDPFFMEYRTFISQLPHDKASLSHDLVTTACFNTLPGFHATFVKNLATGVCDILVTLSILAVIWL
jgi:hypothetical protein